MRWVKITLRTMHLIGMAGAGGVLLSTSSNHDYSPFLIVLYTSGLLFLALEIWSNGVWLIQIRGLAIYLKLILLYILVTSPGHETALMVILIALSGIISHAPAHVRYFSFIHGRRI